jgi:Na+/melibiose symporter-like transporter
MDKLRAVRYYIARIAFLLLLQIALSFLAYRDYNNEDIHEVGYKSTAIVVFLFAVFFVLMCKEILMLSKAVVKRDNTIKE